jgi:glycosyltransferase involved in cell wall biosynthesis
MSKIKVHFIVGRMAEDYNQIFGGTLATVNAYMKAFENDQEFEIVVKKRADFKNTDEISEFSKDCDIFHVDDTYTLGEMYKAGMKYPDVIGPISRSPVKAYNSGAWECPYPADWFYRAHIIRLNHSEEKEDTLREEFKGINFVKHITLIRHGIDTNLLCPGCKQIKKKYILWAGNHLRPAKNYELWEEIQEIIKDKLPKEYELITLSGYKVKDYWDILDKTAILVNTSKYESFCCALFEARAKGVCTIQPKLLNGPGVHEDARIQVEYNAKAYANKIVELTKNPSLIEKEGKLNRQYTLEHASLYSMREDIAKVYKEIYGKLH